MKAIKFKESDMYSLTIQNGGMYLVDGKPIELNYNSKVQVKNIDDVRPISRRDVVSFYTTDGNKTMSVEDYEEKKALLISKREVDADGDVFWNSLDDEFAYRKFTETWTPVYKNIEVIGDPFKIDIEQSQIDSGCPYVKSEYINGGDNPMLFIYNRRQAVMDIVRDKFKSLGMEFAGDVNYSGTKGKKIWGQSKHSGIRYTTAFNSYVFSDAWDIKYNPRGGVEEMKAKYEDDKKSLERIIQDKHNEHFGAVDKDSFNAKAILDELRMAARIFADVEPKQKSYDAYRRGNAKIQAAINIVTSSFKVED